MCGIAGAINNGKGRLTPSTLHKMAVGIEARGRHAYGVAWIDTDNRVRMHKSVGPISKFIDGIIESMISPRVVIFHTRWATHGDATANENNHPHPCDGGWIVHNGQIPNYLDVIEEFGLLTSSDCDSEILGLLMPEFHGTLLERMAATVDQCDQTAPLCMAGIWSNPTRLGLVKRGNPLFVGTGSSGNVYFSSCTTGLPGKPRPLEDNGGMVFTYGQGATAIDVLPYEESSKVFAGSDSFDDEEGSEDAEPIDWFDDDEMSEAEKWRAQAIQNIAQRSGDEGIIEHASKSHPWGKARKKRRPR